MTFDGEMAVDTVVIHPIPVPERFAQGRRASRIIQAALAFDPPVRRQRREYLAGAMQLDLYRAIDIDDLVDIVSRQDPDDPNPPITDRRRVKNLKPGIDRLRSSTLQLRTWEARHLDLNDGDTYLLAVTHRTQTWARNTDYQSQKYALAVTVADEARADIDLFALITERIELPARARVPRLTRASPKAQTCRRCTAGWPGLPRPCAVSTPHRCGADSATGSAVVGPDLCAGKDHLAPRRLAAAIRAGTRRPVRPPALTRPFNDPNPANRSSGRRRRFPRTGRVL